jgi:hypothetical protein
MISDTHEGSCLAYEKGRKELYRKIFLDSNSYMMHLGDVAEAIAVDDIRYNPKITKGDPLSQYQTVEDELRPLAEKGKIISINEGTHDKRWGRIFGDMVERLCRNLKVNYGTFACKIRLEDRKGNLLFKIYATHGHKLLRSTAHDPIRKEANMAYQLKCHLYPIVGDCLIMAKAHNHHLLIQPPIPTLYLTDDGEEEVERFTKPGSEDVYIHPDHRWYVATGSLVKSRGIGFSSYAERMELPPTDLGCAKLIIRDKQLINIEKVTNF